MSRQVWGQMTDLRLTFIDLWWPQNWAFWNICMIYIKKSLTPKDIISDNIFFLLLTIWPLMTMIWPLMTFLDLLTSRIDSIIITKNVRVLHIKWKLNTSVLQFQTSERSNDWPKADLHWPLMTSKLGTYALCISKKSWASQDIFWDMYFTVLDHITSHDP